jgi:hypothetical protein
MGSVNRQSDEFSESVTVISERPTSTSQLLERISALELENKNLKGSKESEPECEIVYFINDEHAEKPLAYQDEPTWAIGPHGEIILRSHFPISDVEAYIEQRQNVAFLVGRFYSSSEQQSEVQKAARERRTPPRPKPSEETIRVESLEMRDAMEAFLETIPSLEKEAEEYDPAAPIPAPYLFWYHHKSPDAFSNLSELQRKNMKALTEWIDRNYGETYQRVDKQLSQGVVTSESMVFLLKRGDAVVMNSKPGHDDGVLQGAIADGYPSSIISRARHKDPELLWAKRSKGGKVKKTWNWSVPIWVYKFDGSFFENHQHVEIQIAVEKVDEEVVICKLKAYPMKYASEKTKQLLESRGKAFWGCRNQRLVAYEDKLGMYGVSPQYRVT